MTDKPFIYELCLFEMSIQTIYWNKDRNTTMKNKINYAHMYSYIIVCKMFQSIKTTHLL